MQDFWKRLIDKYKKIDPARMERYLRSLAREKGLLQSVFESISEAIVVLDGVKRIVFINSTAKEMLDAQTGLAKLIFLEVCDEANVFNSDLYSEVGLPIP